MTERITTPWSDGEILFSADLNDTMTELLETSKFSLENVFAYQDIGTSLIEGTSTLRFNASTSTQNFILYGFPLPALSGGKTLKITLLWSADSVTTDDVVWEFTTVTVSENTGERSDSGNNVTTAHNGTTDGLNETSLTTTITNLKDNSVLSLNFSRLGASGSDTLVARADLRGIKLEFIV